VRTLSTNSNALMASHDDENIQTSSIETYADPAATDDNQDGKNKKLDSTGRLKSASAPRASMLERSRHELCEVLPQHSQSLLECSLEDNINCE